MDSAQAWDIYRKVFHSCDRELLTGKNKRRIKLLETFVLSGFAQTVNVFSCCIGLTNCSGCQIKDCVTIVIDLFKQLGNSWMGPIVAKPWQYMSKHIALGDRSVDICDDDLLSVVPKVYLAFKSGRSLKRALHRKGNCINSLF